MRLGKRIGILSLILIAMFFIVPVVSAHPLGNFTINHYDGIQISPNQIGVEYILDMAEIPAYQEISLLDKNQNGIADPDELVGYSDRQCTSILGQLDFERNALPVPLTLRQSSVSFPPGAGGLSTLRLTCEFGNSTVRVAANDRIAYQDHSYSDRIGWREIVVAAQGVSLQGQYAQTSLSKKLTSYPQDMLSSPLDVRQVSLQVGAGAVTGNGSGSSSARPNTSATAFGARSDRFTQLITLQELTPTSILLALVIAFIWGGLHSLTPGHGKTIVGAYLVGSRGTALHAVYLGLMTTVTHTAGVFLLGFITLFASRYIVPDQLFPWISLLSGALVVSIGIFLFTSRLRSSRLWAEWVQSGRKPQVSRDSLPKEAQPAYQLRLTSLPIQNSLGRAVGAPVWAAPHSHADGLVHSHGDGLPAHTHGPGGHSHTHLPPGADGSKVSLRSLLVLGISGGLLPCPSALVVLLGAIALNRIGFGVVLVLVFSLGLAGVLTGIGLMLVYARRFFDRLPIHSRFVELIPAGSALFITVLGVGVTLQALAQLGWITL